MFFKPGARKTLKKNIRKSNVFKARRPAAGSRRWPASCVTPWGAGGGVQTLVTRVTPCPFKVLPYIKTRPGHEEIWPDRGVARLRNCKATNGFGVHSYSIAVMQIQFPSKGDPGLEAGAVALAPYVSPSKKATFLKILVCLRPHPRKNAPKKLFIGTTHCSERSKLRGLTGSCRAYST